MVRILLESAADLSHRKHSPSDLICCRCCWCWCCCCCWCLLSRKRRAWHSSWGAGHCLTYSCTCKCRCKTPIKIGEFVAPCNLVRCSSLATLLTFLLCTSVAAATRKTNSNATWFLFLFVRPCFFCCFCFVFPCLCSSFRSLQPAISHRLAFGSPSPNDSISITLGYYHLVALLLLLLIHSDCCASGHRSISSRFH